MGLPYLLTAKKRGGLIKVVRGTFMCSMRPLSSNCYAGVVADEVLPWSEKRTDGVRLANSMTDFSHEIL